MFDPQVDDPAVLDAPGDMDDDAPAEPQADEVAADSVEEILVLDEAPDPQAALPVWEPTGNVAVDAALEDLHAVAHADLSDHAQIYERVQQSLRGTLDDLSHDDDPA